ncbi:MAG: glycoside hydrolase family 16 protein [Fibrobacteres bacterium]|nr:glycoside hydrolase family 16 protein [Fibrobacterota bacterium]
MGNGELQFYKKENSRNTWVDSGALKITVRREDTTYTDWRSETSSNPVSSARINTYDRKLWTYGKFEARMKLPKGAGMWPAFWVVPPAGSPYGQWPACGEIDILESYGGEPWVIHGSVHTKNRYGGTSLNNYAVVDHVTDSFHVYTLDWKPDTIAISVDGNEYFRYINPRTGSADWPFDQPAFLILNVAVNGVWENVDTAALPQSLVVDYVRCTRCRTRLWGALACGSHGAGTQRPIEPAGHGAGHRPIDGPARKAARHGGVHSQSAELPLFPRHLRPSTLRKARKLPVSYKFCRNWGPGMPP